MSSPSFEQGKIIFSTRDKKESSRWVNAVSKNIEKMLNGNGFEDPTDSNSSSPNPVLDLRFFKFSYFRKNFSQLFWKRNQVQGNTKCADCGAKNPEWAVINLGIIVCIECSGCHRNLSVSISQVRSVMLDKLDQYFYKSMHLVGNDLFNSLYEAYLDPNIPKPSHNSERTIRESFINAKYKGLSFVSAIEDEENVNFQLYALVNDVIKDKRMPAQIEMVLEFFILLISQKKLKGKKETILGFEDIWSGHQLRSRRTEPLASSCL